MNTDQRIKAIESMLELLLKTVREDWMIDWVTEVAVGRNKGGAYISMYQPVRSDGSFLKGRFCTAYEQDWGKLPEGIVAEAKKRLHLAKESKAVNDREEDRKDGLAWEINPILKVTRFKYDLADDKAVWRLHAVINQWEKPIKKEVNSPKQEPQGKPADKLLVTTATVPEQQADVIPFASVDEALAYALKEGAFDHIENARNEYENMKKQIKVTPLTAKIVFNFWKQKVKDFAQAKKSGALVENSPF